MGLIIPDAADLAAHAPPPEPGIAIPDAAGSRDILQSVARAGFHAVELPSSPGCMADPGRLLGLSLPRLRAGLRDTGLLPGALCDTVELGSRNRRYRTEARQRIQALAETANRLECPLLTVRGVALTDPDADAEDAARYALDTLHDVEQALQQAGVRLAFGGGTLLTHASARDILARGKPGDVGFALGDDMGLSSGALGGLCRNAFAAHVRMERPPLRDVIFTDEDAARELAALLEESGYRGRLTAHADGTDFGADTLERIHATLVRMRLGG